MFYYSIKRSPPSRWAETWTGTQPSSPPLSSPPFPRDSWFCIASDPIATSFVREGTYRPVPSRRCRALPYDETSRDAPAESCLPIGVSCRLLTLKRGQSLCSALKGSLPYVKRVSLIYCLADRCIPHKQKTAAPSHNARERRRKRGGDVSRRG
jgi:hypothetical protein